MNPTIQNVSDKIRTAPRAVTIPAGLFCAILVLAGVAAMTPRKHAGVAQPPPRIAQRAPATVSRPKPPVAIHAPAPSAPAAASPATAAPAPAPAKAATAAAAPAIDLGSMAIVIPGVEQPLNLKPQRARYAIKAQQRVGYGRYGPPVGVGSATVEARTSAFGSLPAEALNSGLPSEGRVEETWTFWIRVADQGAHAFALRIDSGVATASLMIDAQTKPVVQVQSYGTGVETGVGAVELGTGWHTITVRLTHSISQPGSVSASLFARGPNDSAPHSILPFAVDASAAKPASAASAASAPKAAK